MAVLNLSTMCFCTPAMLGSKNISGIAEVYEEDDCMIVLRLYNNKIKGAFENKTAFALLHFKVKVVFPVLFIQKVPFLFQSAKCGEILSIFSEEQSIAGINYLAYHCIFF